MNRSFNETEQLSCTIIRHDTHLRRFPEKRYKINTGILLSQHPLCTAP